YNFNDELDQSSTSTHLNELYLPHNITSILLSDSFWQCYILYFILIPYNISLILTIEPVNSQELNDLNEPNDLIELDEEDNSDMESDSWEDRLCEWEQMLVNEETAILEDEEVEREDNEYDISSDLLSNHTHPAIDHMAKWNLRNLFGPLFLRPKYMNIDE
ncbi:24511_t:CDS:2, partial [Gigaspora rosea]